MAASSLHEWVQRGQLARVRAYLADLVPGQSGEINAYNQAGHTPLMWAVTSPETGIDLVRLLLDHGADVHLVTRSERWAGYNVLALALSAGDPAKVGLLLQRGADVGYQRSQGYTALVDAVHGRDVFRDARLLDLLGLLVAAGADLNTVTSYGESGLRVLSRLGRFDAVELLLSAGADAVPLGWTPLMRAVALGTAAEVEAEIGRAGTLEDRDSWERTPWLLAIQTGSVAKASLLRARGADPDARGRCGKPPLFYAVGIHSQPMLRWLLETGADVEGADEFGWTPLMTAAEEADVEAVSTLLAAGARVDASQGDGQTALSHTSGGEVARRLLGAGADPKNLPFEARRALLGLTPQPDESLLTVSPEEFRTGKTRRFGRANPEKIELPFWEGMIRSGIDARQASQRYEDDLDLGREPVWCARRFGQSITFLPDGRIVQIAGEHEDSYDPDFCIYNDVFVHRPDGRIDVYAYPEAVFPPTDFHTATLLGDFIYLLGSLGYPGTRRYGHTPVYRLDLRTFHMEALQPAGVPPGWIYQHRAVARSADKIRVTGGKVVTWDGHTETHADNTGAFVLNTARNVWTAASVA